MKNSKFYMRKFKVLALCATFFFSRDCCSLNQSQKFIKSEHFSVLFVGTEKIFVKSENPLNQSTLNRGSTVFCIFESKRENTLIFSYNNLVNTTFFCQKFEKKSYRGRVKTNPKFYHPPLI